MPFAKRNNKVMLLGMSEDIEKLEIKISYLESIAAELNEVVIEQNKEINHLKVQIEKLEKKVEDLIEETSEARPNRRPPHY